MWRPGNGWAACCNNRLLTCSGSRRTTLANCDQYVLGYDFSHAFNDNLEFRQTARYTDVNDRYKGFYLNRFVTLPDGSVDDTRATRTKLDWRQHNSAYTLDNNLQFKFATGTLEHTLLTGIDHRQFTRKYQGYNLYNAEIIEQYNPSNYHTLGQPTLTTKWDNPIKQTGLYAQDQAGPIYPHRRPA